MHTTVPAGSLRPSQQPLCLTGGESAEHRGSSQLPQKGLMGKAACHTRRKGSTSHVDRRTDGHPQMPRSGALRTNLATAAHHGTRPGHLDAEVLNI